MNRKNFLKWSNYRAATRVPRLSRTVTALSLFRTYVRVFSSLLLAYRKWEFIPSHRLC